MQNNHLINSLINEAHSIINEITEHFVKSELEDLKQHIKKNNFSPPDSFITDGKSHEYEGLINGQSKTITYSIFIDPLEFDPNGPLLIANYGITNEGQTHYYSSLAEK